MFQTFVFCTNTYSMLMAIDASWYSTGKMQCLEKLYIQGLFLLDRGYEVIISQIYLVVSCNNQIKWLLPLVIHKIADGAIKEHLVFKDTKWSAKRSEVTLWDVN